MKRTTRRTTARQLAGVCLALLCVAEMAAAHAWSLNVNSGARRLFLHVGNGTVSGSSGTLNGTSPTTNATRNRVEVSVPVAQLGNGTALPMTSDSTQNISLYGDGNNTCPTPTSQVMVGAGFRRNNGGNASATLTVASPANLTSAGGDTIPFSQISWTVSAPGSGVPNVISAGTFGGTLTLATVPGNTYLENCHTFIYANSAVRAAGTYNGTVTYTLTAP